MADFSSPPVDSRFVHQIRDQLFYIQIYMYNQLDGYPPFPVPYQFVHTIALEEKLMDWFVKGWIILQNDFEMFERGAPSYKILNETTGSSLTLTSDQIKAPYMFRTDGRNRINIKIYPITDFSNNSSAKETLPPEYWEMNFDCVIYDIEDLPTESTRIKLRKLYFQDERYQIFSERNIQWSSGLYTKVLNPNPTDVERTMPAAEIVKSIISTAASNDSTPTSSVVKVGFDEGGSIDNPNIKLDDFDNSNWDIGVEEDTKMFYTSPAKSNVLQDLDYVLNNCKSADNTPVFLRYGRWSKDKKWKLISLGKYLKDSEKNQIEHIYIDDPIPSVSVPPYMARANSTLQSSPTQNFTSGIASSIKSYRFSPMVAADDARITNRPLNRYNFASGQWEIYTENNTAKSVLETVKQNAEGLYAYNKSKQLLLNLNKTKTSGLMTTPSLETQSFFNKDKNKMHMIKDFLFLNQSVFFKTQGLTFRTPGKFIFLDRATSTAEKNPFDDRFLGQWIMTKVTHLFSKTGYLTEVVATKIDAFSKYFPEQESFI
jgi:hypothetical protein